MKLPVLFLLLQTLFYALAVILVLVWVATGRTNILFARLAGASVLVATLFLVLTQIYKI